jgi:aminoglycoside phosphotransferase (APT) family kinase protein
MKALVPREILRSNLLDQPVVRAWSELSPERVEPEQLEILRRGHKSAIYRLREAGPGGSNVIAKHCSAANARLECTVHQDILPLLPLPALQFYGVVQDDDPSFGWLFLEDAGLQPYLQSLPQHRALLADWLAALHSLQLDEQVAGRLPDRGPGHYLKVLDSARGLLREQQANPFLKEADKSLLQSLIQQCNAIEALWSELEQLCHAAAPALVHGDLVSKNVRVKTSEDGLAFVAFDWENAGWGVPAEDLAWFPDRTVNPDLEAYSARVKTINGSIAHRLSECGKVFRLLDSVHWAASCLAWKPYEEWLAKPMSLLRVYRDRLEVVIADRRWKA